MHDLRDGCVVILLSLGGALLLTLVLFSTVIGEPMPRSTHHRVPVGLLFACLGAWLWTVGVVLAEAIRDQFRKRRR